MSSQQIKRTWIISDPSEDPQVVVNELYIVASYEGVEIDAWVRADGVVLVTSEASSADVYRVLGHCRESYERQ